MFKEALIKRANDSLAILGRSGILKDAYLAGGTAIALQMGHRISVDFDFFTPKEFVPKKFSIALSKLGSFDEDQADKGTVLGKFEGVKFSLFIYRYPLIFPAIRYLSLSIADIRDIAAMKIDAIATRGAKRDFIDLFFICQSGYYLEQLLNIYDKKYKSLSTTGMHIMKSLVYFDDAEPEEIPKMLKKIEWADIKRYFEKEVKKLTK